MVQVSMNELTTYRWSFEEDVRFYSEAGIGAIAVWRHKLSDFGEPRGVELVHDSNLSVSCLMWAGGFTGSDGRSYKESVQDGTEAIRLAADLRAGCLAVYSGARAGHTHNHARRLLTNALKELLPVADQYDINLALEPVHPGCAQDWTFLTDIDDTCRLIEQFSHPRLMLAFDTYYFGHDDDVIERLPELAPQLAIVHLGDGVRVPDGDDDRCLLGQGTVPLGPIIANLRDAGFAGSFDIKLIGEEIETTDYHDLLKHSMERVDRWLGT